MRKLFPEGKGLRSALKNDAEVVQLLSDWVARLPVDHSLRWRLDSTLGLLTQRLSWYAKGEEKLHRVLPLKQQLFRLKSVVENRDLSFQVPERRQTVLFITERSHLKQMMPLLAIETFKLKAIFLTTRPKIYRELVAEGIASSFIPPIYSAKKHKAVKTLVREFADDKDCQELMMRAIHDAFQEFAAIENALAKMVRSNKILSIGVGNGLTHEGRFVVQWAKEQSIPTWSVQHGAIGPNPLYRLLSMNKFFAYGQRDARQLAAFGVQSQQIEVTGAVHLQQDMEVDSGHLSRRNAALQIGEGTAWVLVAWSGYGHMTSKAHYEEQLTAVVNWARQHKDVKVVFKLHRKEKQEDYTAILNANDTNISMVAFNDPNHPKNIFYWLYGSGLLITGNSTVAKEAMLAKVPVISLDLRGEYTETDFLRENASAVVSKPSDLAETITSLLPGGEWRAARISKQNDFIGDAYDSRPGVIDRVFTAIGELERQER